MLPRQSPARRPGLQLNSTLHKRQYLARLQVLKVSEVSMHVEESNWGDSGVHLRSCPETNNPPFSSLVRLSQPRSKPQVPAIDL